MPTRQAEPRHKGYLVGMPTTVTPSIAFGTRNPRRNLPTEVRHKRGEVLFQSAFVQHLHTQELELGVGGGQFELPELGIADYLWVSATGRLDAFEFKLSNWRQGVAQALRYKAYAHRSILVLPPKPAQLAAQHLDAFVQMELGLWSFDARTRELEAFHTPPPSTPLSESAHAKAMAILRRKRKLRDFFEVA